MPESYRILLSKRAAADLETIFSHIAADSPQNASAMVEQIMAAIENLKLFPHRNVVQGQDPGIANPVRSLPVKAYLIFFRVLDAQRIVRVQRVRHGARKTLKRFD